MTDDAAKLEHELRTNIQTALFRLAPYGLCTPVIESRCVGGADHPVYFKCENLQRTGSFKFRGALNKVLALGQEALTRGIVVASTGSHGLALAEAFRIVGGYGTVVVSRALAAHERQHLTDAGLELIVVDGDAVDADRHARAIAERDGRMYVSPCNDPDVIGGQGTIGVEIAAQLGNVELVFAAVGGGGLIAGVATAVKAARPKARIIGCLAERPSATCAPIRAGKATVITGVFGLADATIGGIETNAVTSPQRDRLVDECMLVSDSDVFQAMRDVLLDDSMVIEEAAGAAVAGYRRYIRTYPEDAHRCSAIVLCGGDVGADLLGAVIRGEIPPGPGQS